MICKFEKQFRSIILVASAYTMLKDCLSEKYYFSALLCIDRPDGVDILFIVYNLLHAKWYLTLITSMWFLPRSGEWSQTDILTLTLAVVWIL